MTQTFYFGHFQLRLKSFTLLQAPYKAAFIVTLDICQPNNLRLIFVLDFFFAHIHLPSLNRKGINLTDFPPEDTAVCQVSFFNVTLLGALGLIRTKHSLHCASKPLHQKAAETRAIPCLIHSNSYCRRSNCPNQQQKAAWLER